MPEQFSMGTNAPARPAGETGVSLMSGGQTTQWHALAVSDVASELGTDAEQGLTEDEAARRLEQIGPNALPDSPGATWISLLARQFQSVLVLLLVVAAVLSTAIGEFLDAAAIAAILVLNAVLGFFQEYRADRTLAALRRLSVADSIVIRDGHARVVPQTDLVPGDLIDLEGGNAVPADARVISGTGLSVAEAALTGESTPVLKTTTPVDPDAPLAERASMVHRGTLVLSGHARALVTATGSGTELGHVAHLVRGVVKERSPLEVGLDRTGRRLTVLAVAAAVIAFVASVSAGADITDAFLTGVALAVAAVPEGLPAAVTIVLALGVRRMAARQAVVRRLAAVETLGSTSVICADKTGTLTLNQLVVRRTWSGDGVDSPALKQTAALAVGPERATEATEPTDLALLNFAGADGATSRGAWPIEREYEFDATTMRSAVIRVGPANERILFVKGAAESVLDASARVAVADTVESLTGESRSAIGDVISDMATEGLRPIGLARRELTDAADPNPGIRLDGELTFTGLVGMIDPLRSDAVEAIRRAREAGVRTVMITGDHPRTAVTIAKDAGIDPGAQVLTGRELQRMEPAALRVASKDVDVYARVTSEDKLRIVRALKENGAVVAMTGDGVNDAPALRESDVGVAMGLRGTDAAREAADLVLRDDNYSSIVAAIEEGRTIVANIQRFLQYLLAGNTAEVAVVTLTALSGTAALLPVQILWVNLITDGLPALALGVEPSHEDAMRRPPRPANTNMLRREVLPRIATSAWLITVAVVVAFAIGMRTSEEQARTLAFATLVVTQILAALTFRSATVALPRLGIRSNRLLLGAVVSAFAVQAAAFYFPPLSALLSTSALSWDELLLVGALSVPTLLVPELVKVFFPRAFRVK